MQCPLTLDHQAVLTLIDQTDFSLATADGTAIGDAIVKAAQRLKDSTAQSRVIVLLTDGENNRGRVDPLTAANLAAALGIRIYTIGVGSPEGVPIPVPDPVYGKVYLRNPDGSLLLTRLDEELLHRIAENTGGRYFNAASRGALETILQEIDRLERSTLVVEQPLRYRSVAGWFYLAAVGVLLLEALLSRTAWRVLP
ncbi:MAG: hypothetical protein KatS3mg115_2386 [Candidatus Poribacteria bacterium]|nr:MAG: hypothetical protein KatS3mg115_2386 [Candidatus Poribacteria bacterium]